MKSFRTQGIECRENGICILVKAPYCKQEILVCKKYDTYCHSKACLKERLNEEELVEYVQLHSDNVKLI